MSIASATLTIWATAWLNGRAAADAARHTYLGAAERGSRRLAVVMLRPEQRPTEVSEHAARLLNYGFRLAEQDVEPFGMLVEPEPAATRMHNPPPAGHDTDDPGTTETARERTAGAERKVVVLIIVLLVLTTVIMLHRKTRR